MSHKKKYKSSGREGVVEGQHLFIYLFFYLLGGHMCFQNEAHPHMADKETILPEHRWRELPFFKNNSSTEEPVFVPNSQPKDTIVNH